jgi:hypothetical protein
MMLALVGEQTLHAEYARVNFMPWEARRSIAGVS